MLKMIVIGASVVYVSLTMALAIVVYNRPSQQQVMEQIFLRDYMLRVDVKINEGIARMENRGKSAETANDSKVQEARKALAEFNLECVNKYGVFCKDLPIPEARKNVIMGLLN